MLKGLEKALDKGQKVSVLFTKADGTNRVLNCCKTPDLVGVEYEYKGKKSGVIRLHGVVSVWDIDNVGWRSFREDSLIGWSGYQDA
jgi:hypothetical protein